MSVSNVLLLNDEWKLWILVSSVGNTSLDRRRERWYSYEAMQEWNPDILPSCLKSYLGLLATVLMPPHLIFCSWFPHPILCNTFYSRETKYLKCMNSSTGSPVLLSIFCCGLSRVRSHKTCQLIAYHLHNSPFIWTTPSWALKYFN